MTTHAGRLYSESDWKEIRSAIGDYSNVDIIEIPGGQGLFLTPEGNDLSISIIGDGAFQKFDLSDLDGLDWHSRSADFSDLKEFIEYISVFGEGAMMMEKFMDEDSRILKSQRDEVVSMAKELKKKIISQKEFWRNALGDKVDWSNPKDDSFGSMSRLIKSLDIVSNTETRREPSLPNFRGRRPLTSRTVFWNRLIEFWHLALGKPLTTTYSDADPTNRGRLSQFIVACSRSYVKPVPTHQAAAAFVKQYRRKLFEQEKRLG
ncbi:MAG: hypothetical protein ROR55_21410 [Devosia sp.]